MPHIHETAYPRIKPDLSQRELEETYSLTREEVDFVFNSARTAQTRLGLAVLLKLGQRLGYFPKLAEARPDIVAHVAKFIRFGRRPKAADLAGLDQNSIRQRQVDLVRNRLGITAWSKVDKDWVRATADRVADARHHTRDIVNALLEEFVHHRIELPEFATVDSLATTAHTRANLRILGSIASALPEETKARIDGLFASGGEMGWQMLRRDPRKPTDLEIRSYLQHVERVRSLADELPPVSTSIPRLKDFFRYAQSLNAAEMAELSPEKRYGLAVIYIRGRYKSAMDDAAELFLKRMQKVENAALAMLNQHMIDNAERVDRLVLQLRDLLNAYQGGGTAEGTLDAIASSLMADPEALLEECEAHLAFSGKDYIPFMPKPYGTARPILMNCLQIMGLRSSSADRSIERCIAAVQKLRRQKLMRLTLEQTGLSSEHDLDWLTPRWRKHVFHKMGRGQPTLIERRYFELAVLCQVKDEIKSGDLFVPGGEKFDDYREQLVDDDLFRSEIDEYEKTSGVLTDADAFIDELKAKLVALSVAVDERFPENASARIENDRLVLTRYRREDASDALKKLDAVIGERLEPISIVDVLVDSVRWTGLTSFFRPLAGTDPKIPDLLGRVVATLLCYGCNLGASQTERSLKDTKRRQVAWINVKYASEDILHRAAMHVINAYDRYELPRYWGSGAHASADGTMWSMYEQNLLSEHHIRYGGYGGIGYYHVSDKYIALFSRFNACGSYEGYYILDGIFGNDSTIQPSILHGDTHAQNLPVFGLSHLLGIELMPRIRRLHELKLYKPDTKVSYKAISSLFGDPIDWALIRAHWDDMLRVAVSIKLGKITASTILRRLGTQSRKNKLYFATKELGKAVRTLFLLKYIDDSDVRKMIGAATNKSEQFNAFVKWVFFGNDRVIAENVAYEQQKLVKYSHLVANLVMLHTLDSMTRVLSDLRSEGQVIDEDLLRGLSPYRTMHINRFGDYRLDLSRRTRDPTLDVARIEAQGRDPLESPPE
jgi:TnpA family transposase